MKRKNPYDSRTMDSTILLNSQLLMLESAESTSMDISFHPMLPNGEDDKK